MQNRQEHQATVKSVSFISKFLFSLTCIVSFISIVLLMSQRERANKALSGELITNANDNLVKVADHSFLAKVFEYFGNVTYIFPLVLIYLGYKLFIKRVALKQIDFYLVGLFILGFDLFVLGLCSLFSALSFSGHVGAGGILGDFFLLTFDKYFPSFISSLIPIVLTLGGLFLATAHGPIWYCDNIGLLVNKIVARIKNGKAAVDKNSATENLSEASNSANTQKGNKVKSEPVINEVETPYQSRVAGSDDANKSLNNPVRKLDTKSTQLNTAPNPLSNSFSAGFREPFPAFGANTNRQEPPRAQLKPIRAKETPMHEKMRNVSREFNDRIEPNFGPGTRAEASGFNAPQAFQAEPPVNHQERFTSVFDRENRPYPERNSNYREPVRADNRQSTYPQESKAADRVAEDQKESDNNGPTTIISGLAYKPKAQPHQTTTDASGNEVHTTYITRVEFTDNKTSSSQVSGHETTSHNEEPSVIYKAGVSHLKPLETIGSPMRKPEVSTVITRTTEMPVPQTNKVSVQKVDDNIKGQFTQNEPVSTIITKGSSLKSVDHAYNQSATSTSYNQQEVEANVINFTDFLKEENKQTIKVDSLSPAFIPTERDEPKLQPSPSVLIKESDLSKERYSRGVSSHVDRVEQTPTQVAPSSNTVSNTSYNESQNNSYEPTQSASAPISTPVQTATNTTSTIVNKNLAHDAFASESENVKPNNVNYNVAVDELTSEDADSDNQDYSSRVPFENMSSLSGTVSRDNRVTMVGADGSKAKVAYARATETTPKTEYDDWRPSFDLLQHSDVQSINSDEEIVNKTLKINAFMHDFGVKAQIARDIRGPVITRFDMQLEPGVKSGTIVNLTIDLQRYLMTEKINMIQAVPGTPYMGIEVPNTKRQMIRLADVVEKPEYTESKAILPMCLGVDTVGNPVVVDLAVAPHLLIAGTTGSGKSAGVNSMLVSLLLSRSPAELRLIMVDPKTVEFSQYQGLPHLLTPIITDPESAVAALRWLIKEQERRYKLLSLLHTQNIAQCNALIRSENAQGRKVTDPTWSPEMGGFAPELKPLPYIVLVVDEFADLMAVAAENKKAQSPDVAIGRLAQKARAAGIHLIIATQTPRADIVTGNIKANLPSRIAFTVQNGTESRIILDETGAENLLGNGDMKVKFQQVNRNMTFRAHGPFTSSQDVSNVVHAWIDRYGEPEYVEDVTLIEDESEDADAPQAGAGGTLDPLFDEVVAYVREQLDSKGQPQKVSKSNIQTIFGIGFNRAARIHMQLTREGIIDKNGFVVY